MTIRSTDGGRAAALWGRWGRDLLTALAVAAATYSVFTTQNTVDKIEAEGNDRRNQTCTILETQERADVEALRRTYEYLSGLSPKELGESLNRAVLAQLPRTVRDAETPNAPPYCDEPNVGLPEPRGGVKLPDPPKNLPRP